MALLVTIITFTYFTLILAYIFGFDKIKTADQSFKVPVTKFSVIIPFRNEAQHLPDLIRSIKNIDYPKDYFELIFINDLSDDNSVELINTGLKEASIVYTIHNNDYESTSPKKTALNLGINTAKYAWILTTDADCILPSSWFKTYDAFIQIKHPKMVVAPVIYRTNSTFLDQFQLLDILSLQAVTIGAFGIKKPFLNNGANFGYQKQFFLELNGFEGNTNMASGDDVFLLEKAVKKDSENVGYLKSKDAIVITVPQENLRALLQQRLRWASKSSAYKNGIGILTAIIMLSMNLMLVLSFLVSIIKMFSPIIWLTVFLVKFGIDLWCILKAAKFFNRIISIKWYLLSSIFYPVFTVFIAFSSLFFRYKWKGRSFSK